MTEVGELASRLATAADPYPTYDRLRAHGRVLWVEELGRWLVTGHRETLALLTDERMSSDRRHAAEPPPPPGPDGYRPGGLPFVDPPDHTRLRSLVHQAFTARAVERLLPTVRRLAGELLTAAAERGEADLITDVAGPLPAIVLAELLGLPAEEHGQFRSWATRIIEAIDPVNHRMVGDDGARARLAMNDYLAGVIEQRRRRPAEDLISGMVRAEEAGQRLTADELLEMCLLLAVVGIETTTNLVGNGVSALLDHPSELARLRADPGLVRSAVEEVVRYDSPIQFAGRIAVRDVEVGGQLLRRGQVCGLVLGAANRDPDAFPDPNRLDLGRYPNNHVAFGRGIHFCLGAPLARLEGAVLLAALVTGYPGLGRAGEPVRRRNVHVRGFESMPVTLGAAVPVGGRS